MFKLYPQTLIILWMSGTITLQEKGNITSIQSTDSHLSHVTTLLLGSTEDPGMTPKTGKNNFPVCSLHIAQTHHMSARFNRTAFAYLFFLAASGSCAMITFWMAAWLRGASRLTFLSSPSPLWRECRRSAWWTWAQREQRRPFHIHMRKGEPSVCLMSAVSHFILSFKGKRWSVWAVQ